MVFKPLQASIEAFWGSLRPSEVLRGLQSLFEALQIPTSPWAQLYALCWDRFFLFQYFSRYFFFFLSVFLSFFLSFFISSFLSFFSSFLFLYSLSLYTDKEKVLCRNNSNQWDSTPVWYSVPTSYNYVVPTSYHILTTYLPGRDLTLQLQFRRKGYDDGVTYHNLTGRNIAPGWDLIGL